MKSIARYEQQLQSNTMAQGWCSWSSNLSLLIGFCKWQHNKLYTQHVNLEGYFMTKVNIVFLWTLTFDIKCWTEQHIKVKVLWMEAISLWPRLINIIMVYGNAVSMWSLIGFLQIKNIQVYTGKVIRLWIKAQNIHVTCKRKDCSVIVKVKFLLKTICPPKLLIREH